MPDHPVSKQLWTQPLKKINRVREPSEQPPDAAERRRSFRSSTKRGPSTLDSSFFSSDESGASEQPMEEKPKASRKSKKRVSRNS